MNTYRAIQTEAGRWAIVWYVDEMPQGLVWGWHETKAAALIAVLDLARMEYREAPRAMPPATDKRHPPYPRPTPRKA
jgi:hypothetical protein